MSLHDDLFLRLIEYLESLVEEGVRLRLILLLGIGDFHSWSVITDLASFLEHGHVGWRVDLLKSGFQLIEQSQGDAALALHDTVNHFGVKNDPKIAEGGLELCEILNLRGHFLSKGKSLSAGMYYFLVKVGKSGC